MLETLRRFKVQKIKRDSMAVAGSMRSLVCVIVYPPAKQKTSN